MYKIVFFDIDGTLRDEESGVPSSAREAVRKLREKDIKVCLCTGRTKATLPLDIKNIAVDYLIAGGGCHVEERGLLIKESFFPGEAVDEIYSYLGKRKEIGVVLECRKSLFMNRGALDQFKKSEERKRRPCQKRVEKQRIMTETIVYENNFNLFLSSHQQVSKICLWLEQEQWEEVRQLKLGLLSQIAQEECLPDGIHYLELIQKGCGKGDGVKILLERLGIQKADTLAFGDGMNDVDLFQAVGTPIAMGNGKPGLFPYADSICEPPMEDGIYRELERRKII